MLNRHAVKPWLWIGLLLAAVLLLPAVAWAAEEAPPPDVPPSEMLPPNPWAAFDVSALTTAWAGLTPPAVETWPWAELKPAPTLTVTLPWADLAARWQAGGLPALPWANLAERWAAWAAAHAGPAPAQAAPAPALKPAASVGAAEAAAPAGPLAPAATYAVDRIDDVSPPAQACTAAANDCSLRGAILAANANAGADTITLPAGIYTLSIAGADEDAGATGDLDILGPLTLNGAGAATTTINGGTIDRVLHISGTHTVAVNNVRITGGLAAGFASSGIGGGGILSYKGTLTLSNSRVDNNAAAANATLTYPFAGGGGIASYAGTLTVQGSVITGNAVTVGSAMNIGGGGILVAGTAATTLTGSTVDGNTATGTGGGMGFGGGGGIAVVGDLMTSGPAPDLSATAGGGSCSVSNNTTDGNGGGILQFGMTAGGALTLSGCDVDGNAAMGAGMLAGGGGILTSAATATLTDSSISSNTTTGGGGGLLLASMLGSGGTATLSGCTVAGNTAAGAASFGGGGIAALSPALSLTNCRVQGNIADVQNASMGGMGGGGGILHLLVSGSGTLAVTGSTIAGNSVGSSNATGHLGGGGILAIGAAATLTGSTVDGNTATGTAAMSGMVGGGGGIAVLAMSGSTNLSVTAGSGVCSVSDNRTDGSGGGILHVSLSGGGTFTLGHCTVDGNDASGPGSVGGGGILTMASTATVTDGSVQGNSADVQNGSMMGMGGGGGILQLVGSGDAALAVTNTPVSGNTLSSTTATGHIGGGGILQLAMGGNSTLTVTGSAVDGNIANGVIGMTGMGGGGGIEVFCLSGAPTLSVTAGSGTCSVSNNATDGAAGGGILQLGLMGGGGTFTLDDCAVDGNRATGASTYIGGGGGIMTTAATATMSDCSIDDNATAGTGGGLMGGGITSGTGSGTMTRCTVDGNDASGTGSVGGGGIAWIGSSLALTDCSVQDNTADVQSMSSGGMGGGGGIFLASMSSPSTLSLTNTPVSGNELTASGGAGHLGGGGILSMATTTTLVNSPVDSNNATGVGTVSGMSGGGGGIAVLATSATSDLSVTAGSGSCSVSNNTTDGSGGGILQMSMGGGTLTLDHCTVDGNDASGAASAGGGGIATTAATATLTDCSVQDNRAAVQALYMGSYPGGGGGILHLATSGGALTVTNTPVSGNILTAGSGGSHLGGGGILQLALGGSTATTLVNSPVDGNSATGVGTLSGILPGGGGGIALIGLTSSSSLSLAPDGGDCSVSGNATDGSGGGILQLAMSGGGTFMLDGCTVNDNDASGAASLGGGGILTTAATAAVTDCFVQGNTADMQSMSTSGMGGGGGILHLAMSGGTLTVTNTPVSGNTLTAGGGASHLGGGGILALGAAATLTNSPVENNSATGVGAAGTYPGGGGGLAILYGSTLNVTPDGGDCRVVGNTTDGSGGGILYLPASGGTWTLTGCTIDDNTASGAASAGGGGIATSATTVTLTDCSVQGNTADAQATAGLGTMGGGGGGILQFVPSGSASLTLSNTPVTRNAVGGASSRGGGGIALMAAGGGSLTLTANEVMSNTAEVKAPSSLGLGCGGGIFSAGAQVTLNQSKVGANTASGATNIGGGGICALGAAVNLTESSVYDNAATLQAAVTGPLGTAFGGGGGILTQGATVSGSLDRSTISGNTVDLQFAPTGSPTYFGGGGILALQTPLNAINCTISGNSALGSGAGAGYAYGGGILKAGMGFGLDHSTVAYNTADAGGGVYIYPVTGEALTAMNSIIGANSAATSADCSGTLDSWGYNLIGASSGCTLNEVGGAGTNWIDFDPGLEPLDDYGGPTLTHKLLYYSPAWDAAACVDQYGATVSTDQRNVSRPYPPGGGLCDIGAYEGVYITDLVAVKEAPETAVAGQLVVYTIAVRNDGPRRVLTATMTDTLPLEVEFVSTDGDCDSTALPVLVCDVGVLDVGQSYMVTIAARLAPDTVAADPDGLLWIENHLLVGAGVEERFMNNNEATAATLVSGEADLAVFKVSKPDTAVAAGETFTYTIYVDNYGPSAAAGVAFSDNLLASGAFTLIGITADAARDDTCSSAAGQGGLVISCLLNAPLEPLGYDPANGRWVVQVAVRANETMDVDNLVTVYTRPGGTPDPEPANNQTSDFISVLDTSDLSLEKIESRDPVLAGNPLQYILTVRNNGPSTAENVVVEDWLPAELEVDSVSGIGPGGEAACTAGTPGDPLAPATCNFGALAAGQGAWMYVNTHVRPDTVTNPVSDQKVIQNSAAARSDSFDPDNSNSRAGQATTVLAEANLTLAKYAQGSFPWTAGELRTYIYSVENAGPSVARDVSLVDFLPAGVQFVQAWLGSENRAGSVPLPCAVTSNHEMECSLGDIPLTGSGSGPQMTSVFVDVLVDPDLAGGSSLVNNAWLTSDTPDPGGASDSATVAVASAADVRIQKTASDPTPLAGGDQVYHLVVTNYGPSTAHNVELIDSLPPPDEVTPLYASDGACTFNALMTGVWVNCPVGDLGPGETYEVDLHVRLAPDLACGLNLLNLATATWDGNPTGVSAEVRTPVDCTADLRILKTDSPDPAVPGEGLVYTLRVDNDGPSDAVNVIVTDTLPAGVTYDDTASSAECDEVAPGTVVCTLAALAAGESYELTIAVGLDESIPPPADRLTNRAEVASDAPDPNRLNNVDWEETRLAPLANLAVSKTGPATAAAGESLQYTLIVSNTGASAATNVVLYDRLPAGLTNVRVSAGPAGLTCTTGTPGDRDDPLTCGLGTVLPGGRWTLRIDADIVEDVPDGTWLENDAWVTSDTLESDNADNQDFCLSQVTAAADLAMEKTATPAVLAGEAVTYTLRAANGGPATAVNVRVRDDLPAGAEFLRGSPECALVDTTLVTCALGDLADGQAVELFLTARVASSTPAGTLTNRALVAGDTADPDDGNNLAAADTSVTTEADLALDKLGAAEAMAGDIIRYDLAVTNAGPSDAAAVQVVDTLPAGFTYRSDTDACAESPAGTLTCALGTLPAGAGRTLSLYVQIDTDIDVGQALGEFDRTNTAAVSSTTPDPAMANNSETATTRVHTAADLAIAKLGDPAPAVVAGERLSYTLVVDNLGPAWALDVAVTDKLDPAFDEATLVLPPACTYAAATRLIGCALGDLADGQRVVLDISAAVRTEIVPPYNPINNRAEVASPVTPDPDLGNNVATTATGVVLFADLSVTKGGSGGVVAGTAMQYTLEVINAGPSAAHNVTLADRLPGGVTVTAAAVTAGAGTCTTGTAGNAGDKLACGLGTLDAGEAATVVVDVLVDPALPDGTVLENDAWVAADSFDPENGDNYASLLTTVTTESAIELDKADSPDPVRAGEVVEYEIHLVNNGPSLAHELRLLDLLTGGAQFLAFLGYDIDGEPVDNGAGSCFYEGVNQQVRCELGDVAPGSERTVYLRFLVDPATQDGTLLTDEVTLAAASNLVYQPVTEETTVNAWADLAIVKASSPVKVYAGEQKKYTITVTNHGPSDALGVTVTDTLPAGVSYEIDTAHCTAAGQVVTCALGTLVPGQVVSYDLWGLVDPAYPPGQILVNWATVSSLTADPVRENNTARADNLVLGKADLKIVKFGKMDGEVRAGDMLTYTIVVDNLGPSYAHSVVLTDLLQSSGEFTLVSVESDRPATCSPVGGTFRERLVVQCRLDGDLEVKNALVSGRWMVTLIVTADETQDVNNLAQVVSADLDPNWENNEAYVEHDITDVSDLNVSKCVWWAAKNKWECGDDPVPVIAGETVKYRLYLTNYGPSTAEKPVVYDTLPLGTTLVSIDDPGWDCSITQPAAGQTAFTCGYPNLPAGEMVQMTYTVRVDPSVPEGTILTNGATVTSSLFDPNTQNDYDEMLLRTGVKNVLWMTKSDEPDPVIAGNTLVYSVEAGNDGPSTAWDVLVWDGLPPQVVFKRVSVLNRDDVICNYNPAAHEVNCTVEALRPGESVWLTIEVEVKSGAAGSQRIYNEAEVWSGAAHAAASAATMVETRADLSLTKSGEPAKVFADGQVKYTLTVKNSGPSAAREVVVSDELPGEVQIELLPDGCAALDADTVECRLGTLGDGAVRTIEFWVRVRAGARDGTELVNEACVTGATTQGDPAPGNNCATAIGLVLGLADLKVAKYGPAGAVVAGEDLTYLIVVDNLGPGYAHNVAVDDLLQSSGQFELASVTSDRPASCAPSTGTFNRLLEMRCELNGPLEVRGGGASGRWLITVVVRAITAQTINNVAGVTGSDPDPNPANNEAVVQNGIEQAADLAVAKTAIGQVVSDGCGVAPVADAVTAGLNLTYTITVINYGPSAARRVVVEDRLPAGIVVTGFEAGQGSCQTGTPGASGDKLTCGLGQLDPGDRVVITVRAHVPASTPAGTVLENDVSVASDALDLNNANNAAAHLTTVSAWADLSLAKEQSPAFVMPGDEVIYTLTIHNAGPSDAPGAVVSDTLAAEIVGATWSCEAFGGGACPASGEGSLRHSVDLPAGAELIYTIRGVRDRFGTGPTLSNTAEVIGPAGVLDCDPADNADTAVNRLHKVYLPLIPRGRDLPQAPDLVVRSVAATGSGVEVVIANEGNRSVENPFWVDLYLNPSSPPARVGQLWIHLAAEGMVWGVTQEALPLEPGETLTLRAGDPFYSAINSRVSWPIEAGTEVWVQVDSSGDAGYGAVREMHELLDGFYNNIAGPVTVVTAMEGMPSPPDPLPPTGRDYTTVSPGRGGEGLEGLPRRE